MLSVFLSACRTGTLPLLLLYLPMIQSLSLSDLDSFHSISHSQCPDIFKYSKPSGQGDCTSFPSRGMSHPVLLSSKHLHFLRIYAEYLRPPLLDTHSVFLHLHCAQEVDLWGWHQWVLVQLGTSGERECLPPCQGTGAGMSLTAPAPSPCGKSSAATKLLYSPCDSSTSTPLQISPPLNTNKVMGH